MADPLSDILTLVEAHTFVSGRLHAGGDWAVLFPPPGKIKFSAVLDGACWLLMDGRPPVRLDAGDVIAVNGRLPFTLASDPTQRPVSARDLFRGEGFAQAGAGDDVRIIGGHVAVEARRGDALMDVLPPLIHVRGASPEAESLRWLLDRLGAETASIQPGAAAATGHLGQLMFLELLRTHLAQARDGVGGIEAEGWLAALGDPRLAPALHLMHGRPACVWTVEELAAACALSRTAFAVRFKATAGVAPLTYLAQWRIRLAERALRDGRDSVAAIARSVGYGSESAFTHAFKRIVGASPRRYRVAADLVEATE